MQLTGDRLAMFRDLETRLHRSDVRSSPSLAAELIADDFLEFGKSGRVYDKATILAAMQREPPRGPIDVEDFAARELAPGVVLVTYRGSALRSSIWVLQDGKWRMAFHQGTS